MPPKKPTSLQSLQHHLDSPGEPLLPVTPAASAYIELVNRVAAGQKLTFNKLLEIVSGHIANNRRRGLPVLDKVAFEYIVTFFEYFGFGSISALASLLKLSPTTFQNHFARFPEDRDRIKNAKILFRERMKVASMHDYLETMANGQIDDKDRASLNLSFMKILEAAPAPRVGINVPSGSAAAVAIQQGDPDSEFTHDPDAPASRAAQTRIVVMVKPMDSPAPADTPAQTINLPAITHAAKGSEDDDLDSSLPGDAV